MKVIHIVLHGRLGNRLFQYALGRRLALRHQTGLRIYAYRFKSRRSDWFDEIQQQFASFNMQAELVPDRLRPHASQQLTIRIYRRFGVRRTCIYERIPGYDPALLEAPDECCLHGYFQSERYFEDISSIIREDLRWRMSPKSEQAVQLDERIRNTQAVSVHVRRMDYLNQTRHVCTPVYYEKAVALMRKRLTGPHFFIFSDDIAWCRSHMGAALFGRAPYTFMAYPDRTPVLDLRLMTACKHHIIANSTFSWWGAWLSESTPERLTMAPCRWFNDLRRDAEVIQDILPSDWQRISF